MASERAQHLGDLKLRQSVQSILQSVERLSTITDNYLRFSRTSSGKKVSFDLGEALDSVLATYALACEEQRIRVSWHRPSGVSLVIHGDRDGIEQALGNLMSNAIQALDGVVEPKIEWTLGVVETGSVWIRIRDSGPGISSHIRQRLFAPFSTTKAQGTGLGLSWVKRVIEEHSGSIEVLERGETQGFCGASFVLVFPAGECERISVLNNYQEARDS